MKIGRWTPRNDSVPCYVVCTAVNSEFFFSKKCFIKIIWVALKMAVFYFEMALDLCRFQRNSRFWKYSAGCGQPRLVWFLVPRMQMQMTQFETSLLVITASVGLSQEHQHRPTLTVIGLTQEPTDESGKTVMIGMVPTLVLVVICRSERRQRRKPNAAVLRSAALYIAATRKWWNLSKWAERILPKDGNILPARVLYKAMRLQWSTISYSEIVRSIATSKRVRRQL